MINKVCIKIRNLACNKYSIISLKNENNCFLLKTVHFFMKTKINKHINKTKHFLFKLKSKLKQ